MEFSKEQKDILDIVADQPTAEGALRALYAKRVRDEAASAGMSLTPEQVSRAVRSAMTPKLGK